MGNECCAERPMTSTKSRSVEMHNADHTLKFEDITPKSKYWEDYYGKVKVLRQLLDNWGSQRKFLTVYFVDIETQRRETQTVPQGFISWDDGDVRQIIRKFYEYNKLPPPALSPQAWHSIWIKHEREAKNTIDLESTIGFTKLFTEDLHALVTDRLKPVEVAPKTFVPGEKAAKDDWHKDYTKHIETVKKVVDEWDDDHIKATVSKCFSEIDNGDGNLQWNNSEIRRFIVRVFSEHQVPLPKLTESQWYLLYRKFDKDGNNKLSRKECEEFVKMIHQEITNKETDWTHMGTGTGQLVQAANGTGDYVVAPTPEAQAPAAPEVNPAVTMRAQQSDWRAQYEPAHVEQAQKKLDEWDSANIKNTITDIFRSCDKDGTETLQWNNSEIKQFVEKVFKAKGLPVPQVPESVWYQMYREVDHDGNYSMSKDEAAEFALHVLQRVLQMHNVPMTRAPVPVVVQARIAGQPPGTVTVRR
eukprot:gnl/MRDRNA2_/MRDRNA2_28473_c0_seq1.p1 gnl/MRDRNA2_/MRDRNA2_28473_c0~~gnl/MRDRNA2_/MRDRNA2_28473_c0_seq1.p1  ORF type:complete len:472 (-),score=114.39 gnl/MRDRNA2_/MRDRNA2_28473_c0_seq1:124-1539(-)